MLELMLLQKKESMNQAVLKIISDYITDKEDDTWAKNIQNIA